jgi:hypothetical protein
MCYGRRSRFKILVPKSTLNFTLFMTLLCKILQTVMNILLCNINQFMLWLFVWQRCSITNIDSATWRLSAESILTFSLVVRSTVRLLKTHSKLCKISKSTPLFLCMKRGYKGCVANIYGIQLWSCGNTASINNLFLCQKTAVRIVTHSAYNSHTEPLFKNCLIFATSISYRFFSFTIHASLLE